SNSFARAMTLSIGKPEPQSQWPPPQEPRSLCWQTPRPPDCACEADSLTTGIPNARASSAIQRAQFSSMFGCWFQSAVDQLANANSSVWTATGSAFAAVQALPDRCTYSPTIPSLSSIPVCELTPAELEPKNEPSDSIVNAPSAVCRTISRTVAPPRELQ